MMGAACLVESSERASSYPPTMIRHKPRPLTRFTTTRRTQFRDEVSAKTALQAFNGFKLTPTDTLKLGYAKR